MSDLKIIGVEYETEQKILGKLKSIGMIKMFMGQKPFISTPEFKHILGSYHIKHGMWFTIAKYFEKKGCVKLWTQRGLFVRFDLETMVRMQKEMNNSYMPARKTA
jgi:hypothetical protein